MKSRAKNGLMLLLILVIVASWTISPIVGKDKVKVHGNGELNLTNKTHFELKAENKSGDLKGNLEYNDKGFPLKVKGKVVTFLNVTGDKATIMYNVTVKNTTGTFNGNATLIVWDNGKKGKPTPDNASVVVMWDSSTYTTGGQVNLTKGDIKVNP